MEKLWTSLTIVRHSLDVMRRHPRLLAFPVFGLLAAVLVYLLLLAPLLFDISLTDMLFRRADKTWESLAPWHAADAAKGNVLAHLPFAGYALYYLFAIFVATFVNVALYSEIIAAMNGGRVSITRGFAFACTKLSAIGSWSILAGTVGVVLRLVQQSSGPLGKWIAGLAGFSWTLGSVFVIPVIINEPQARNPFDYLKISTGLIKRVWGEGVIGLGGVWLVAFLLLFPLFVLEFSLTLTTHRIEIAEITAVIGVGAVIVLTLAYQILECGLYVYATEGVAPGTFDEEIFERAWTVRRGTSVTAPRTDARRMPRFWLWLAIPIAITGVSVLRVISYFHPTPPPPSVPLVRILSIDLADLDYALNLNDLQSVGLFVGKTCPECDFSAAGSQVRLGGKIDDRLGARMARRRDHLYLMFYGEKDAINQARVTRSLKELQSHFAEHADAFTLMDSIPYEPRTTVAAWNPIPGAASYTVELDCFHCCGWGKWCTEVGSKWKIVPNLNATTYTFDWVGAQPGRWRVWAVDRNGRSTAKSAWTNFDYSL